MTGKTGTWEQGKDNQNTMKPKQNYALHVIHNFHFQMCYFNEFTIVTGEK